MSKSFRPSQNAVAGVACRYMDYYEAKLRLGEARVRIESYSENDIYNIEKITADRTVVTGKAIVLLARRPAQSMRRRFLYNEQQKEGFVPGQENIARYALQKCMRDKCYPLARQALNPLQN